MMGLTFLNQIIFFEYWKNMYSIFCAIHNVTATNTNSVEFNLHY